MTEGISVQRLAAAVPRAADLIAGVEAAKADGGRSLDTAVHAALLDQGDPEAVVLALANMAHALAVTLAHQTGTTVPDLLASMTSVRADPGA